MDKNNNIFQQMKVSNAYTDGITFNGYKNPSVGANRGGKAYIYIDNINTVPSRPWLILHRSTDNLGWIILGGLFASLIFSIFAIPVFLIIWLICSCEQAQNEWCDILARGFYPKISREYTNTLLKQGWQIVKNPYYTRADYYTHKPEYVFYHPHNAPQDILDAVKMQEESDRTYFPKLIKKIEDKLKENEKLDHTDLKYRNNKYNLNKALREIKEKQAIYEQEKITDPIGSILENSTF